MSGGITIEVIGPEPRWRSSVWSDDVFILFKAVSGVAYLILMAVVMAILIRRFGVYPHATIKTVMTITRRG